ncbi:PREDICTED: BSD domain-containing protein 1 [Tarenaya hassleriana]|uniref:BSD domain-containing protein 1 n=1 Tax=Tarenaya hassleriana TaxID=28532 RepID=UPI00053C6015|nr:PREDICTED: BSD domain-containing protein 1 [Tarenaya hassleriana]
MWEYSLSPLGVSIDRCGPSVHCSIQASPSSIPPSKTLFSLPSPQFSMDLFKSVFSEYDHPQPDPPDCDLADPDPSPSWSFGGLIKTLATKSESVIGSYRRDFEEFGSELKKETSIIREVASRAVKDLPQSLEIGASVAQESLESVGQAIDDIGASVWKSTAQIISHGRESLASSSEDSGLDSSGYRVDVAGSSSQGLVVKPYSRFEMQLLAVQSDRGTYCREPDDSEDFENWKLGFKVVEKSNEIDDLINENKSVKEIYDEIMPAEVDAETFWCRYFYRVHKLQQAEEARAKLVQRAISGEEEDLSWDFDDDEDETDGSLPKCNSNDNPSTANENLKEKAIDKDEERDPEKAVLMEKLESRDSSCKDSDISVVSTQPSLPEVEDLGWDQLEDDIGSNEERRDSVASQGSGEKADWRNRIIVADEGEDLSWDIENGDDDESTKR